MFFRQTLFSYINYKAFIQWFPQFNTQSLTSTCMFTLYIMVDTTTVYMLWFNFILGLNIIFLNCFWVW